MKQPLANLDFVQDDVLFLKQLPTFNGAWSPSQTLTRER